MGSRFLILVGAALISFSFSFVALANSAIVHVPGDFQTIAEALDAIATCDTVMVAPGVYQEELNAFVNCYRLIGEGGSGQTTIIGGVSTGHFELAIDVLVQGFTIRDGFGLRFSSASIGSRVTVRDCIVEGNSSAGLGSLNGGGVYSFAPGSPFGMPGYGTKIESCVIRDNQAMNGGGVYAIWSVDVENSVIVDNVASDSGGGVFVELGRKVSLRSITVAGNQSVSGPGGGLHVVAGETRRRLVLEKAVIADNGLGFGVFCSGVGDSVSISCTDVWGNEAGSYGGDCPDPTGTAGNFSLDPLFCNPENGDYGLMANSPCAPGNSPPGCNLIGALPVACGVTNVADEAYSASLKLTVIPNPVRGAANLELNSVASATTLSIFDAQGRLVEQLKSQDGHWNWTPVNSVPVGVYFARLDSATGESAAAKFLYLR